MGLLLGLLLLVTSCDRDAKSQGPQFAPSLSAPLIPTYHIAFNPRHNPARLIQIYQPLISYLNNHIHTVRFVLEASRNYTSFGEKINSRRPELIFSNPLQTLRAIESGYHVLAMEGSPEDYRGLFLVRRDSTISKPTDLKGKSISYPAANALAACILPMSYLHRHGINVNRDIDNRFVGSQDSAIMNVFLGHSAAATTWTTPWTIFTREHPHEAAELKVVWETEPLINNAVMMRDDISEGLGKQVTALLQGLENDEEGQRILRQLAIARFHPATDSDYQIVEQFMTRFRNNVRSMDYN